MATNNESFYDGDGTHEVPAQTPNINERTFVTDAQTNAFYKGKSVEHEEPSLPERDEATFVSNTQDNSFYRGTELEHRTPQRSPLNTPSFYKGQTFNVLVEGSSFIENVSDTAGAKGVDFTVTNRDLSAVRNFSWVEIVIGGVRNSAGDTIDDNGDKVKGLVFQGDNYWRIFQTTPKANIINIGTVFSGSTEYTRRG